MPRVVKLMGKSNSLTMGRTKVLSRVKIRVAKARLERLGLIQKPGINK